MEVWCSRRPDRSGTPQSEGCAARPRDRSPFVRAVISGQEPVLGLNVSDFIVHDANKRQELTSAAFDSQVLDIEILMDTSPTMTALNEDLQGTVKRAVGELGGADRVGVMEFGEA